MHHRRTWLAITMVAASGGTSFAADSPSVAMFEQAFERRMLALKPAEAKERNVLFESVRAGTPEGNRYPFEVSGSVRDYDAGFPRNKYYGQTCVGRMNKSVYTLWKDVYGAWQVDGAMTLSRQCKPNSAEGVSSIPAATLAGSPAPAASARGAAATPPAKGAVPPLVTGSYECWHFSRARLDLNFTLQPGGRYIDAAQKRGSYQYDGGSGKLRFTGAGLDGQSAVYHAPGGRPTVSFRDKDGAEIDFCQSAGH